MVTPSQWVGQQLSHYTILEQIGAGGMGVVYRAHDEHLERDVAIKVLPPGTLSDEIARKHFRKEALALAKLNHPNVETIFEFGSESGLDFLVTEYIPGQTLDDRLTAGPLDEKEVLRLGAQLVAGVTAAHEQGMVHRDLKPGNLRLTPDGRLKVLDFGLARLTQADLDGAPVSDLAQTCGARGTLPYMAPEQLLGQKVDSRSDVWAIGAVLQEMATACRPFPQTESGELMVAILQLPPESPRSKNPNISAGLEAVVLKALSKKPAERYQSATDLGADLAKLGETAAPSKGPQNVYQPSSPAASSSSTKLELAHVLFMDIVAYSQMPMDEQGSILRELQEIVRGTTEFSRAEKEGELIRLPTGDGMALVFFQDAEAPVRCAIEVAKALHAEPGIKLRMGIHTGPVYRVADINANRNVAGGGINSAQRVMDCGDSGHILVSRAAADVLEQTGIWASRLHDLGEAEVKHGVRVHIYNLYTDEVGNSGLPQKLRTAQMSASHARSHQRNKRFLIAAVSACLVAVVVIAGLFYARRAQALTEKDTIVLADFANSTGDAVFDDTLKTALDVSLRQSPFLNVLSDSQVAKTLQLMTRSAGTKLTPEVAREVCQRAGSKAYVAGSIRKLGSQYVLGLQAINCQSGDPLAQEQETAAAKEKVLDALGSAASKLRGQLGESLATVQKFDVPLEQATTSSLEALKAYTIGEQVFREADIVRALPYFQHAIQLDPNFAMGFRSVGRGYFALTELERASKYYRKAFELREHASEREKLAITADYYRDVSGELNKAVQTYQEWIESYPRDYRPHGNLGIVYAQQGQYEKSVKAYRQSLRLSPDNVAAYSDLGNSLLALQQFDEARQVMQQAQARKLDDFVFHYANYALAFLRPDSQTMAIEQQWFAGQPDVENFGLSLASDTEAYAGVLGKARELTTRSVESAIRADSKETGAIWQENTALREAAFGNVAEARQAAAEGLKLVPASQGVALEAALAFAMVGDTARAESLAQDLNKRFPLDTQMQTLWLPAVYAQLELDRKSPADALNRLQAAGPAIELGQIEFVANISCVYPIYIRGEAYLAVGQGSASAAEFQKILDHSGIVWNCWTGALARLGVARANALQARTSQGGVDAAARARALAAYQEFLILWKDADPDIPMLKQAKAEYARLQ